MPIYNEVDYVEAAVSSVLAQEYDGPVEIVLALAPSTDGTDEVVHRLAAADERITVVDNPSMHIPVGLNLAIAEARYPVVIRVDAHTQLEPDYTERGVAELERSGGRQPRRHHGRHRPPGLPGRRRPGVQQPARAWAVRRTTRAR